MLNGYMQIVRNFLTLAGDLSMQYSVESLKDQVAIVTGGASGIGRAMVLALLKVGAYVIVPDNNEQAIIELKAMASSDKLRCSLTDLGQREAGPAVINLALKEFKKIGLIPRNAKESQSYLHIYNTYCSKIKCTQCEIGICSNYRDSDYSIIQL